MAQLASRLSGVVQGYEQHRIDGIASLMCASASELAYFDNVKFISLLQETKAGAVLLSSQHAHLSPVSCIVLPYPRQSIYTAFELFDQVTLSEPKIHPQSIIAESASLGKDVFIGAGTFIGENVVIGDHVHLGPHCYIADGVSIGQSSYLSSQVTVHSASRLGCFLTIDSGVVLGASPFNGIKKKGHWQTGPAVGGLIIGDRSKIGANTVISKGAVGETLIGDDVHLDNLVHIAHDVIIGSHSALAGCAAVGAFVQVGEHCIIGGASCIAAHVRLGNDIVITGMSTVNKSLSKPGIYSSGTMVSEHTRWRRNMARFKRLDAYIERLLKLEKTQSN